MMDFLQIISGKKNHKSSTPPKSCYLFSSNRGGFSSSSSPNLSVAGRWHPRRAASPPASLPDDKSHLLAVLSHRGSAHLTVRGAATPRHCVRERLSAWPSEMVCFITLVLEIYHFLYLPPYAQ